MGKGYQQKISNSKGRYFCFMYLYMWMIVPPLSCYEHFSRMVIRKDMWIF